MIFGGPLSYQMKTSQLVVLVKADSMAHCHPLTERQMEKKVEGGKERRVRYGKMLGGGQANKIKHVRKNLLNVYKRYMSCRKDSIKGK